MTWWTVAIGVDTHKQWHVAVALDRLGRMIDSLLVDATSGGYQQLLVCARHLYRRLQELDLPALTT